MTTDELTNLTTKADVAGVQAVQDYGPSYLESKTPMPGIGQAPLTLPDVARLCDDRLIAMGGDTAKYLTAEREARTDLDRALVYTKASTGESDLALAVKAQYTGAPVADED